MYRAARFCGPRRSIVPALGYTADSGHERGDVDVAHEQSSRWLSLIALGATLLGLASCQIFIPPTIPEPPDPDAEPAEANALDSKAGAFPLFVGARWVYRNATSDLIPVVHPGSGIESEVLAEVRCRDAASGQLTECFVLRTRQGAERETISYFHRAADGIEIYAVETRIQGATPRTQAFGGELFLKPALAAGAAWGSGQIAGDSLSSEVLRKETVPLRDTIHTLLGPYTNSFTGAWRVRSTFGGILADAYGSGIVECWYSTGVGMVKRTAGSLFYELVTFRRSDEVAVLDEASDFGPHRLAVGSLVAVQLRGYAPAADPGLFWSLENRDEVTADGVLGPLAVSGDFYADLSGTEEAETGTYVFRFAVTGTGRTALDFEGRYAGAAQDLAPRRISFDIAGL